MAETLDPRGTLFKAALDAYKDEYGELYQTWRNIEAKAQGNVAIAGIFLAGLFAFLRDIAPETFWWQKALLVTAGCALGISVLLAALVLKVRTRLSPQVGRNIEALVRDLTRLSDESDLIGRLPAFASDQMEVWRSTVSQLEDIVQGKAKNLRCAQIFLALGVVAIVILVLAKIVRL